nr:MAG TPA: hypothetical protein [Caudoviricetes sp.]DAZ05403.1 MAG TPA: hypothetical protein [Caudoviricetes sp.]
MIQRQPHQCWNIRVRGGTVPPSGFPLAGAGRARHPSRVVRRFAGRRMLS